MTKGIKGQLIKAGMAVAMAAPVSQQIGERSHADVAPRQLSKVAKFGTQPEDAFLWTISQLESNGGRNTEHKMVSSGPQRGEKAMGRWGLLYPTVQEMIDRGRATGAQRLPGRLAEIEGLNRDRLAHLFKQDPDTELDVARSLGRHVLRHHKGDRLRAAYSWLHGHNLSNESISEDMLAQSPYVSGFSYFDTKMPKEFALAARGPHRLRNPASTVKRQESKNFRAKLKDWQERHRAHERQLFASRNNYVSRGPVLDTRKDGPREGRERVEFVLRNLAEMNEKRRQKRS